MDEVYILSTYQDNRNINIDILRIVAALMVLFVHIGFREGVDFSVGAYGVQLFFILSGYLGAAHFGRGGPRSIIGVTIFKCNNDKLN